MRRLFLLGLIIVIISLTGCTSLQDNNSGLELNTYEDFIDPPSIEKGDSEEVIIVVEVPSELKGSIEDEALRVNILAEIDANKIDYKTTIEFTNKTSKSLDLLFDCGLLISNGKSASSTGVCLSVESMLLKKNDAEKQTMILPKDFFDMDSKLITVRYRQDQITKVLEIQLEGVKVENVVTRSVEASDFVLEVTTPTVISNGGILKVKGVLKYIGDETVTFTHGGPIIRFSFTGSNESRAYVDLGYGTELKPGQTFKVEDEFKVTKTGKQELTVRTTTLDVNGALIEGVGNETYLEENIAGHILEIENSRLSLYPIEILVD